ncbi:hypothetical protein ACFRKD_20070 [Streptomyces niveus]|uniref:hypothetical protein n=1 Tax=Streptomyces niveus TaxID=193462 RepID=UPI00367751C1
MDFESLRQGNFSALGTAINDWSSVVKSLTTMEKNARDDFKAKADKADWSGANATVTREFVTKTAGEFTDALTQATTIRDILRDTKDELVTYRDELNRAIEDGWAKKLSVVGTADNGFKVYVNVHPEPANSTQLVETLRDTLQGILNKATTTDSTAARVLRAIAEQADYGFSGIKHKDRDSAAEALQKADAMAKLAKKTKDMSAAELTEFIRTVGKYKNDELFAAQFATELGSRETLQFWADMADTHAGAKGPELKQMQELQKNLSMTLATATLSDADSMQEWKKNIIQESNTAFRTHPSDPFKNSGALGYQVMSSLMGQGKYDAEFLNAYGKKLLKVDMAPAGSPGMGTNEVWKGSGQTIDLVFGKDDGRDPMTGFMKGLSHNPEAAINTFNDKSVLDHVLESSKYTDRGSAVGVALEAAVTGVGNGELPTDPRPHTVEQVEIMRNVMHAVAQPDEQGERLVESGLGKSFGNMASAYMSEISRVMAGDGADSIFLSDSDNPNELDKTDATRFLYEVSQDKDGRAGIILGQTIYTSSLIEAHIADPSLYDGSQAEAIRTISESAGLIQGVVGHANADGVIKGEISSEKEQNEAVKQRGDFLKAIVGAGIGAGAVTLAPGGAAAIAGAAGSGYFGGLAGMAIDGLTENQQADGAADRALYRSGRDLNDYQASANSQVQQAARDAIAKYNSDLPPDSTMNQIRDAVDDGWVKSDTVLEGVHGRPTS